MTAPTILPDTAQRICAEYLSRKTPEALGQFLAEARRHCMTNAEKHGEALLNVVIAIRDDDDMCKREGYHTMPIVTRLRIDKILEQTEGK